VKHHRAFDKRGLLAMRADFWGLFFDIEEPGDDFELRGNVAIVSIEGPLTHHAEWFWDSYDAIKGRVAAALDSSASTVLLRIDSPGGDVAGCFETAREIRALAASKGKRLVAYADGLAASAAYALACAAEAIYLPETGFVGSIGVISTLMDVVEANRRYGLNVAVIVSGERKRFGHPDVPISSAAVEETQRQVDGLADIFFALVSECRAMPTSSVAALQAGVLLGKEAVAAKLADGIATLDGLIEGLSVGNTGAPLGAPEKASAMGWKDEMKKAAEDGDEDAKRCLDAMGDEEGEDEEPAPKSGAAEDPPKPKDGDSDEPPPSKNGEEEPKDDKAAARGRRPAAARGPTTIEARVARIEEARERDALLASRADLPNDLRKKLATAPLETVRWTIENLPRVANASAPKQAPASKTDPRSQAAAVTPAVTRGATEGGTSAHISRRSARADELDQKLGFGESQKLGARDYRNVREIPLMTPSQARRHVKDLEARKAQMNGGK
jgi:ClpP class serine protease